MTNTIEFWKDFSEEVYTISIHPAGHQILAGFSDKLRLLNILIDDFRVVREFPIRGNDYSICKKKIKRSTVSN